MANKDQNMQSVTPGGRSPVKGNKSPVKTVAVGRKGPPTVTPAGATQPGKQGRRVSGNR